MDQPNEATEVLTVILSTLRQMSQPNEVTEVLTVILSTLRQAEAAGLTVAEARQRIEAEAWRRWRLESEFLESLEIMPPLFTVTSPAPALTFPDWLDAVADMLPAGTVLPGKVADYQAWYESGWTVGQALGEIYKQLK